METELKKAHETVWAFRSEVQEYFPTPDTHNSLRFAYTEVGEAIDAYLRLDPLYSRNNTKQLDVLDELADAAMMLLTALGPGNYALPHTATLGQPDQGLDFIAYETGAALHFYGDDVIAWQQSAWYALQAIAAYPGMALAERIGKRQRRIQRRLVGELGESVGGWWAS